MLAGLAAALLIAEVGLRTLAMRDGLLLGRRPLPPFGATTNLRQQAWVEDWIARRAQTPGAEQGIGRYDTELGWVTRESASSLDGHAHSNALAARGAEDLPPRPATGTLRVLTFGDSFTWCDGVGDDGTWQHAMRQRTEGLDLLNFGVGGYGTDQSLLRFRRVLAQGGQAAVAGHVVTIGMMLENIGRNVNRYRPLYYPASAVAYPKPRFVLSADGALALRPLPFESFDAYLASVRDGSVIADLAADEHWRTTDLGVLHALTLVRLAHGFFTYQARDHRGLWQAEDAPFDVTLALLRTFQAEAIQAGARLAPVLIFPAEPDLQAAAEEGAPYWTSLHRELERSRTAYLDLSVALLQHCAAAGITPGDLYSGGHLTPAGNAVVADALLTWILDELPAHAPRPRVRPR